MAWIGHWTFCLFFPNKCEQKKNGLLMAKKYLDQLLSVQAPKSCSKYTTFAFSDCLSFSLSPSLLSSISVCLSFSLSVFSNFQSLFVFFPSLSVRLPACRFLFRNLSLSFLSLFFSLYKFLLF